MAYDITADDTQSPANAANHATGVGQLAILRKINLNVDIATQAELNEAITLLSGAISSSNTAWQEADQQLSSDLKAWALGSELSGAIHNEITDEATTRFNEDEAIRADLSNNYKVTVVKDETPETSAYVASYTIKQGETVLSPKINIPKDYVVKSAALCTVTEAGVPYQEAEVGDKYIDFVVNTADQGDEKHIYLPVKDLVDVYTGGTTEFATVNVDSNRVITTNVSADLISAAAVTTVVGTNADLSSADTIWGAKAYAEDLVTEKNVTAEGETGADALVTASAADNNVSVGTTQRLQDVVAAVETSASIWNAAEENAKAYTDQVSGLLSTAVNDEIAAEATARSNADEALSTAIDSLSGTYVDKDTYDDAAIALDTFSTGAVSALNDYQDIDDIIKDLIALKAAVATFAAATKNA